MTKVYGKTAKRDSDFNVLVHFDLNQYMIFFLLDLSVKCFFFLDAHNCNMAVIWGAI